MRELINYKLNDQLTISIQNENNQKNQLSSINEYQLNCNKENVKKIKTVSYCYLLMEPQFNSYKFINL